MNVNGVCVIEVIKMYTMVIPLSSYVLGWTGWTDEGSEGTWRSITQFNDILTNKTFQNWKQSEPDGLNRENCAWIIRQQHTARA